MPEPILLVNNDNGVVVITLNNPDNRNALSLEMIGALTAALTDIMTDKSAQVVVIKGNGPAFSSGHNLKELIDRTASEYREVFQACGRMMNLVQALPQPVIAQVKGAAFAAGCQLVAACDLAVAAEGTIFGTPGVNLGLFCNTPSVPLTRCIGRKKALDMLLTGRVIDADEAERFGLVSRVVPEDKLEEEAMTMARTMADRSPMTVKFGKEFFYKQIELDEKTALAFASEVMVVNTETEDAQEGIKAFLEKRKANWKGC